ncbi:MAG: class I SAM-dependent methyltransferase [Candidatus Paceibacterota bacterium]|jgi:ubiquinone/menaquinone biosynthesis C-methylase UbiE
MKTNKTSWGKVADWYDDLLERSPDSFQEKVILPNLLRLLDIKKDVSVLDVACGQGYFTRAFHEKGAQVTGFDISQELIDLAKKSGGNKIKYFVASADDFTKTVDQDKFDAITIILALQNIENINGVFEECAKVLKPGGQIAIVLNHSTFRIPKRSSWIWDEKENKQYRRIDGYMRESHTDIDMTPGETDPSRKKYTVSFHRPLQTYFKLLDKNGFAINRLEEWISHKASQPGPRASEEDRMRKEIPMFIAMVAKKF